MSPAPAPTAAGGGDKRLKLLDAAMRRQQFQADGLLEVLHAAQELYGFLGPEVLRHVGRGLKLPMSRVFGVATFYNHFTLRPKGEHTCTVCMGTACYVKGAGEILAAARKDLGIGAGEDTTKDRKVSVVTARCVGACAIAPAIVFDQETVGKQTPESVVARVKGWTR